MERRFRISDFGKGAGKSISDFEKKGLDVTGQISNPHDKLIKQLLGEPENAADFVANKIKAAYDGFGRN